MHTIILFIFLFLFILIIYTISNKLSCNYKENFSNSLPKSYNEELHFYKNLSEEQKNNYLNISKEEKIKQYFS